MILISYDCELIHTLNIIKGGNKMKVRKIFLALILAVSMSFILVACGGDDQPDANNDNDTNNNTTEVEQNKVIAGAAMQDGTYALEEKDLDDNGWKVSMEITVEDGKIVSSDYDYTNEEGQLKSEDEGYQEAMSDKVGVGPQEFIKQLNDGLVATQNAQEVDIVTGATSSSEAFINYAQQLIQAAQNGDTETIVIHNQSPLQDGEYSLEEKNIGSTGWKFVMNMTVADGKIVESDYNYLNADGEFKTDDEEYQKTMTEKAGIGPQDFIPQLNEALVETQDPAQIDVVSGATHSAEAFKIYAAQLVNAAQKGETGTIEVDNFVYEN